jgi:hypothetical protein
MIGVPGTRPHPGRRRAACPGSRGNRITLSGARPTGAGAFYGDISGARLQQGVMLPRRPGVGR